MRFFILVLLLSIFSLAVEACEGFEHDIQALEVAVNLPATTALTTAPFPEKFSSRPALEEWAKNSTLGGGRVEDHPFMGQDFVFVYRSYTSGIKSSDASVYEASGAEWTFVKNIPVIPGAWIEARREDDAFVFRPDNGGEAVMTLTADDIAPDREP